MMHGPINIKFAPKIFDGVLVETRVFFSATFELLSKCPTLFAFLRFSRPK